MANVLTDLAADIYKAADVVGRELVGFIPASTINANGSERVAKGDVVRASFTREAAAVDVSESMTIPEGTDQTVDNKTYYQQVTGCSNPLHWRKRVEPEQRYWFRYCLRRPDHASHAYTC
jgi:hypothetical protein